ncbi:MAG: hypothetical protein IKP77_03150 [Acholeplasmatales bacterium]|nr:hypothetical protein [Acholeplasmatales bacterium]
MKKKLTNDEKIIAAFDAIDRSVANLQKFGEKYNQHIDNAALRGDDKRAKQLIKQKIGVYNLANQLVTLKNNLELGAYTASVAADLGKLPDAIAGCKGLLAESPDFNKVGKDIKKIFKDMEKPAQEIEKLNNILDETLAPKQEKSLISRLDNENPEENTDQFKAEYAAMLDRIKSQVGKENVAKPQSEDITATGDIDFEGIIADENKRK